MGNAEIYEILVVLKKTTDNCKIFATMNNIEVTNIAYNYKGKRIIITYNKDDI